MVVIGAGGHARVLLALLSAAGREVVEVLDDDTSLTGQTVGGLRVAGTTERVASFTPGDIQLVNGVGGAGLPVTRAAIAHRFREQGYRWATLVHPAAWVAPGSASGVALGEGVQVMAGAVVQPGVAVGDDAILNTRCGIDHDTTIGACAHIAPGATLCGGVRVGTGVLVGAGATVQPGVTIGDHACVAAGAAVHRDVPANATVGGVPARVLQ